MPINPRPPTRSSFGSQLRLRHALSPVALLSVGLCAAGPSDATTNLPFVPGEKLVYDVTVNSGHKVGQASMWIEGPVDVRGTSTYLLRFDSRVRIALMSGVSSSSSWFDPDARESLRFRKSERSPLGHTSESVEMFPATKSWTGADGKTGVSPQGSPLDELSFIYFIRTLPMVAGEAHRYDRHFDAARDPVIIQVVRPEVIPTAMGEVKTMLVEMRVRDPKHYKEDGVIRFNISNDACRLPVRIESTMPMIGQTVMTMKSMRTENSRGDCSAVTRGL
ncbi:MAG: DUF3108 domain-containing protein [Gemmatimonadota bacterium]|nr:DUF3108 domain-containing protein [Gemmatimonadota bacterium]